jgi:ribosome recycling factor
VTRRSYDVARHRDVPPTTGKEIDVIDETLFEAEEKMEKAVSVLHNDLGGLRTGRASASAFNRIAIDYYGAMTPLPQLASVSIPEARMAVIKPYDAAQLGPLERAIRDSDLGVNPTNDGNIIRVLFPQLTEERRREFVKVAKSRGEDAKVSIRSVRRHANETFNRLTKDGEVGEDEARRAEAELQKLTDKYVAQVDESVRVKEAELLEV